MEEFLKKLKNFWWYHKFHLLIAAAAAALLLYSLLPAPGAVEVDYHIGVVTAVQLPDEAMSAIEARLAAAAVDVNADGELSIKLHPYPVDLADSSANAGYNNYEKISALDADLVGKVSGLFILDDPEAFLNATSGLLLDYVNFDASLSVGLRKDATEKYVRLFEALK